MSWLINWKVKKFSFLLRIKLIYLIMFAVALLKIFIIKFDSESANLDFMMKAGKLNTKIYAFPVTMSTMYLYIRVAASNPYVMSRCS